MKCEHQSRKIEILEQIDKNLIFEGTSPESLSKGLEIFLKNPEFFSNLKSKCRETAEKYYSWEKVTDPRFFKN